MLEFYYGTVNSAKTLTMLAKAYTLRNTNKHLCIIKPEIDTRSKSVKSRVGLASEADIILKQDESLSFYTQLLSESDIVLVDEAQFLSVVQVKELRLLSCGLFKNVNKEVQVQCYGLRTLSDGELWESSSILMAQADALHEISTVCSFCLRPAVFSKAAKGSEAGVNPSWDGFVPVCARHFFSTTEDIKTINKT